MAYYVGQSRADRWKTSVGFWPEIMLQEQILQEKLCNTNNLTYILSPTLGACFECTLLQQHICYMRMEHCAFKFQNKFLEHMLYAPS